MVSEPPKPRLTVDAFLAWSEDRPGGYELLGGEVFGMSPQRVRHAEVTLAVQLALRAALHAAGSPCRSLPDGLTVRIDDATAFEPDALVYCGDRLDADAVEVPAPVIVVEVLSPSTHGLDTGHKLNGYFRAPSVMHSLIVDPKRRLIVHHRRATDELMETRIAAMGTTLDLTPPGLALAVAEVFEAG